MEIFGFERDSSLRFGMTILWRGRRVEFRAASRNARPTLGLKPESFSALMAEAGRTSVLDLLNTINAKGALFFAHFAEGEFEISSALSALD